MKKKVTNMLLGVFMLTPAIVCAAPRQDASFDAGFSAYQSERYADSAATFESLLKAKPYDPILCYNAANAYFKAGQKARAYVLYERALKQAPRDKDIAWNLSVLKGTFKDQIDESLLWSEWPSKVLSWYSKDEALCAALLFGGMHLLFSLIIFVAPALNASFKSFQKICLLIFLIAFTLFGLRAYYEMGHYVIVSDSAVDARYGPSDKETKAFSLHEGAKLKVRDELGGWVLVSAGDKTSGWIPQKSCLKLS